MASRYRGCVQRVATRVKPRLKRYLIVDTCDGWCIFCGSRAEVERELDYHLEDEDDMDEVTPIEVYEFYSDGTYKVRGVVRNNAPRWTIDDGEAKGG